MWTAGGDILPLELPSPDSVPKAAATLLADMVIRAAFGQPSVFTEDAYRILAITDPPARDRLRPRLTAVLDILRQTTGKRPVDTAWSALVAAVGTESGRQFPRRHPTHTEPLGWLRDFLLRSVAAPVPGLTVHQAKGREWDAVGVRLTDTEQAALQIGLDPLNSNHRIIYVALTRATSTVVGV
ncbi:ATP-binding domain-containing protein [Actinoplanes derwentensis]|uniref:ATP-binding domain-containing protein n=1 Tax=Actinoplanes derwentensis TaxID=113562 RepID=UPI000B84E931|nr:ATP-binding domain-containing protein [Actinoplanes derwentensis]GID90417.1 hypothetical protein Ade03nite_93410 [Actinoplanes derwentensis]